MFEAKSQGRAGAFRLQSLWRRLRRKGRRGTVMVEFAIVGPVFLIFLFAIFEVAYDQYLKSVLDTALQATARQIQVGQASNGTTEALMVSQYLCPNGLGLLNCSNLYIRVERLDTTACPGGAGEPDFYDDTNGLIPVSGGQLGLNLYGGTGATPVLNGKGPGFCDTATSTNGFCTPGPSASNPEFIILSAIYVAPSFLGRLLGNNYTYNGKTVRAIPSDAAFITEGFTQTPTPANAC
jgi:hypothetical protein